MANYVTIFLDTTAPASPSISLENGAIFTSSTLINAYIATADATTVGYQMKIWGDVDPAENASIQATEALSSWITFEEIKQIRLAGGDGQKTVNVRLRDDVYNESALASDSITLDMTKPVVTVTQPDVTRISKIDGRNMASFSFTVDTTFEEYQVKVVSSSGASHDTGTLIGTANGSTNTSGEGATFDTATSPINVSINGTDLETASSSDGEKIIKVFVRDDAGNWSA